MSLTTTDRMRVILAFLLFALCLGVVGTQDAEDEALEFDRYCQMVRDGYWPNYREAECPR